jgi:hypothetical protein
LRLYDGIHFGDATGPLMPKIVFKTAAKAGPKANIYPELTANYTENSNHENCFQILVAFGCFSRHFTLHV